LVAYLTENCCGLGASYGSACATPAAADPEIAPARRAALR
jgi:hypothetical protein